MADFYYRSGEEVVGPLTGIQLREAAFARQVFPDTLVASSKYGPWSVAAQVKGLFDERGRPLPHPPEAQRLIAEAQAVDVPVPPPIQLDVPLANSVPARRRRKQVSNSILTSPTFVATAVAIAFAVAIFSMIAVHPSNPVKPVVVRPASTLVPAKVVESRTSTEIEPAPSQKPDRETPIADKPLLPAVAQPKHPAVETPSVAASEPRALEIPDRTDVPLDAPRESPLRDESASIPRPVRAESDDETPRSADSRTGRELPALIAAVEPSVVTVVTDVMNGSGFVVDVSGLVFTNHHVIRNATRAQVVFEDGQRSLVVGTLLLDEPRDIALLKIDVSTLTASPPALPLRSALPNKGEAVAAFGAPLGLSWSVSDGIVSGRRSSREVEDAIEWPTGTLSGRWIQTTTPISKGNSGGPLSDMNGKVVGLNTLALHYASREGENINFAISCLDLAEALEAAKSAAVTPLPKKTTPPVAVGGSTVDGIDTASDWLQPVTTSEKFLWSLPAGSFYIDGDRELHQFTSPQREWGRIVGFTIDSILVQFDNSKAIGYVRLINLGSQIRTVGAHMRLAEADLRSHDAASDADLLSERWKQSQRGMITHGAILDGKDRQHRIDTGTNIRPPGPTATDVWYRLMIQRLGFGQ
jgi:S1-C subfamily serine protease